MFFRQFVKHPGMIGSVIPSSPTLVARMLDGVDWQRTRLFVEYGPGLGTFTHSILERLHPDATLLAIDLNLDFVAYLESEIRDPRLRVVHGSAADVRRFVMEAGYQQADYVLSGIPFSTLPDGVGDAICAETRSILRNGGAFLVYQYSRYVRRLLDPLFDQVSDELEWRNIPPCRLFHAIKAEALAKAA
ncbi:methyltransferase domain-containing protein [Sphingobium sp. AP49]|uniref:class I SAM-dependent methyltransferase n=1 Tax=Sphingobium sp. AP49 TaxID=1144307 RepID=UPI0002E8E9DA|nr:methyltransferase domain-containing protein [Sphingobium sp. AP49]WHO41066.1 methyltransferase domain-containing protein [Sphingobium sp. AP49]